MQQLLRSALFSLRNFAANSTFALRFYLISKTIHLMKKAIVLLVITLFFLRSYSQSGLTIQAATPFVIVAGTPLSVDGLVLQPSANFTITAPNTLVRNTAITNVSPNPSIKRAFKLSNTVNGFSGAITINYLDAELNGIAEPILTLNVHNGTVWTDHTAGVTRDATNNFVTTTGISNLNLNELTLASVLTPLPLSWGTVNASRINMAAQIEWTTYDEQNTGFFEIERSADGIQFNSTGLTVQAFNTPGNHHYQVKDLLAPAVKTFYRIREIDRNGHATYSHLVFVNAIESNLSNRMVVYPNPAYGEINIQLTSSGLFIRSVRLISAEGRLLQMSNNVNSPNSTIATGHLAHGLYWLQIESSDGTFINHSLIKQ
jgi:hypothetical protein